jgi:hypothetical protein
MIFVPSPGQVKVHHVMLLVKEKGFLLRCTWSIHSGKPSVTFE